MTAGCIGDPPTCTRPPDSGPCQGQADWVELIEIETRRFRVSKQLVGRGRFELPVSWSQTRRFTELSHRPSEVIQPDRRSSAPDSSMARTARARSLYRRFSSGGISPHVFPVPGTRKIGS